MVRKRVRLRLKKPPSTDVKADEKTERPTHTAEPRPEKSRVAATFYIERETSVRLRILAIKRGTSQQKLLTEALDEWLAKQDDQ